MRASLLNSSNSSIEGRRQEILLRLNRSTKLKFVDENPARNAQYWIPNHQDNEDGMRDTGPICVDNIKGGICAVVDVNWKK